MTKDRVNLDPESNFGTVSLKEFLSCVLHEHKCARDEILQRCTARNYIIGIVLGLNLTLHVQVMPHFFEAQPNPVWPILALIGLPLLWESLGIYLVVNLRQIDRLGLFVTLLELKVARLFRNHGGEEYRRVLLALQRDMESAHRLDLSTPLSWERLLRSRKGPAMASSRVWDSERIRTALPLLLSLVFSTGDIALLVHLAGLTMDTLYSSIAILGILNVGAWIALSRPVVLGNWNFVGWSRLLSLDEDG